MTDKRFSRLYTTICSTYHLSYTLRRWGPPISDRPSRSANISRHNYGSYRSPFERSLATSVTQPRRGRVEQRPATERRRHDDRHGADVHRISERVSFDQRRIRNQRGAAPHLLRRAG